MHSYVSPSLLLIHSNMFFIPPIVALISDSFLKYIFHFLLKILTVLINSYP